MEEWFDEGVPHSPKGKKRKKDYKLMKVEQYVFDDTTLRVLYKLRRRGVLKGLGGPVSAGKESIVFHAIGGSASGCDEIALKMYKVSTSNFNAMLEYIIGDPRFDNIKKDRRSVVFTWARKEFKNLKRAYNAGVSVPRPVAYDKNVLVMEFIGENGVAAPRLKDVPDDMLREEAERIFERIIQNVRRLYEGNLVHADLSEFNILLKFAGERSYEEKKHKSTRKVNGNVKEDDENGRKNVKTERVEMKRDGPEYQAEDDQDEDVEDVAYDEEELCEECADEEDGRDEEDERGEAGFEMSEDMLRDAEPVFIDFGQALLLAHPRAMDFLLRDIKNITSFFNKLGLDVHYEDVYERIMSA